MLVDLRKIKSCNKWLLLVPAVMVYVGLSLYTLEISPPPAGDEGWYAQAMENMARTGKSAHSRVLGILGMDRDYLLFGKIYIKLGSLAAGENNSLWYFRLPSFLGVLICTLFLFLWLQKLYDGKTAGWSVAFLLLSTPVFVSSHTVRPEGIDLALLSGAFYFAQRSFFSTALIFPLASGLNAGLLPSVHIAATPLICILGLWWIWEYRLSFLRERRFWVWVFGVGVGLSLWLWTHLWSDPSLFWIQWDAISGGVSPSDLQTSGSPFACLFSELHAFWAPYGFSQKGIGYIPLFLLGAGWIHGLWGKDKRDLRLALTVTCLFVLFAFTSHNKYGWYVVFYLFFLCPLLSRMLISPRLSNPKRAISPFELCKILIAGIYLLVGAVHIGGKAFLELRSPTLAETGKEISREIPRGEVVLASSPIVFMNPDFIWVDTWFVKILRSNPSEQARYGKSLEDALVRARIGFIVSHTDNDPDLAILNPELSHILKGGKVFEDYHFLEKKTRLVKIVNAERRGKYVIRRVLSVSEE